MFFNNRFTQKAERAVALAQEAAMNLGHGYVGTEHLLLGLVKVSGSSASKVLISNGATENKIIRKIDEMIGIQRGFLSTSSGFTPRTKKVLDNALDEANGMSSEYVDTEHLLMSLLNETDSVAVKILSEIGVDINKLITDILENFNDEAFSYDQKPNYNNMNSNFNSNMNSKFNNGRKNTKKRVPTPTLDQYSMDLIQAVKNGKVDPVIGRNTEIERLIQILSRRTKNNPCLIGEPGVGKTAVVEGFAHKIVSGDIPNILKDKRVVSLDLSAMVAGAKYRGEFEDRLKKTLEEIKNAQDVILFIDEFHTIVNAGAAEGAIDAANILKPSLARGEIQIIGATTINEFKKYIEKDAALERRFQPILVEEPSAEETVEILKGIRDKYEAHHNVKITDEAINAATDYSQRYIADRFLPDKAIDLVDEAASKLRLSTFNTPPDLRELEDKIKVVTKEKQAAIKDQDFEKAAKFRDQEQNLKNDLVLQHEEWKKNSNTDHIEVTPNDIAGIVSSWTGIPVNRLTEGESERLLKMEEILHKRVIGQSDAVKAVSKAVRRGRMGLKDPKRPVGSFIFLGPTGVGKTELSKALAEAVFGNEDSMIRVDMSEFMEKHTVSRLVGSPPGYVGFEEGGQLTEKVRRKPYSVILFDEIEKAHPDVFNILLQILEDGRLTDAQGRKVNFQNTIIIMTSNVGARSIAEHKQLGFGDSSNNTEGDYKRIKSDVMNELKKSFRPEFLNRVDDIIVFHKLEKEEIKKITHKMLNELIKRLAQNQIHLEVDNSIENMISEEGFDPLNGARPLRRAIQSKIEDFLADEMLRNRLKSGSSVKLTMKDGEVVIQNHELAVN